MKSPSAPDCGTCGGLTLFLSLSLGNAAPRAGKRDNIHLNKERQSQEKVRYNIKILKRALRDVCFEMERLLC